MDDHKTSHLGFIVLTTLVATLGGFLFGFDSGVISGAVGALKDAFHASSFGSGFNVSSMLLGCAAGALSAGNLSDRWGRLNVLKLSAFFFLVSAWGSGFADTSGPFIFYRVIGGLAVGAASVVCPAYISEIAPARIRGRLGSLQQMAIVLGLFISFLSNYWIAQAAGSAGNEFWFGWAAWKWMFWVEMLPAAVFGISLFFIPESPRYLVKEGYDEKAAAVLTRLGHTKDTEEKLQEIRRTFEGQSKAGFRSLLDTSSGKVQSVLWIGLALAAFQQLSGINIIFYYGPVMWQAAGFSETSGLFQTAFTGGLNIVSTLIAISLVDKLGRKKMLFTGAIGMFVCLASAASIFAGAPAAQDGSLLLNEKSGLAALLAANGYVAFFAITWGPVTWVLLGEMFPNRMRGVAISLSGMVIWIANFMITMSFESLLDWFGLGIAYWGYASFACLSIFFVWKFIPETKGKTLEEM